jgi:precorrin-6B methylase 2
MMNSEKIVINYITIRNENKRLELIKDTEITKEIIYSLMYLHSLGVITLSNALPITEIYEKR